MTSFKCLLFCPQPKDILSTVILEGRNHKVLKFTSQKEKQLQVTAAAKLINILENYL